MSVTTIGEVLTEVDPANSVYSSLCLGDADSGVRALHKEFMTECALQADLSLSDPYRELGEHLFLGADIAATLLNRDPDLVKGLIRANHDREVQSEDVTLTVDGFRTLLLRDITEEITYSWWSSYMIVGGAIDAFRDL